MRYYKADSDITYKITGKIKGKNILVISVWNSDKSEVIQTVLTNNDNTSFTSVDETVTVSANNYLCVSDYNNLIYVNSYDGLIKELDETIDKVEKLEDVSSDIVTDVLGNTINADSTVNNSFIRTDESIVSGYSDFAIYYYSVNATSKINVSGAIKGNSIIVVSIWNSSKETIKEKLYISSQNVSPKEYSVDLELKSTEVLAVTQYKSNLATVTVLGNIDTRLIELENFDQPELIPPNGSASGETQTTPDFATLSGKTWNAVGDSITHGDYYRSGVGTRLGLTVVEKGVSSCTLAINNTYLQNQSIVERVCGLNGNTAIADADIWTIFGGVNDVLYETPLGSIETTDKTTIYGALKAICENIRGRSNNPKLFLLTPAQSNRDNTVMQEIVKAIKIVGKMYACPVIDVYNESGICHTNIANVLADGVHPNTVGSAMLVSTIASGIERNC